MYVESMHGEEEYEGGRYICVCGRYACGRVIWKGMEKEGVCREISREWDTLTWNDGICDSCMDLLYDHGQRCVTR